MKSELGDIYQLMDTIESRLHDLKLTNGETRFGGRPAFASLSPGSEEEETGAAVIIEKMPARNSAPGVKKKVSSIKSSHAIKLEARYLQSQRIVAYDGADPRARPYDVLRAYLCQVMQKNGWHIVGVTSPTPRCGKTLTAVNLAFSVARQRGQDVLLVDMDFSRPQIAKYLHVTPSNHGVLDLLRQRGDLEHLVVSVSAGENSILVLPTASAKDPSSLIDSEAVAELLQSVRDCYPHHLIILDLPPSLTSDEVITILPETDCFLLVTAVGSSKVVEIEECLSRLRGSHLLRVVVNKATDQNYFY